jgi:predicted amidohydrolase
MRVAALQVDCVWEDAATTCRRVAPWIATAAAGGARLAVLPEMFACGFSMDTAKVAEPPEGPTTVFLREEAAKHGLWLGGTVPERSPEAERPANTFVLAGPGGELHRYRKIRPFTPAGEKEAFDSGFETLTVEIPDGAATLRVTPFICYDLRFADLFWDLAEATDLFVVPANWPETRRHHWKALLVARAIENQAFVLGVNRVGTGGNLRYTGDSRIVDPLGEELAAGALGETALFAEVTAERVAQVRRELPFLADRT